MCHHKTNVENLVTNVVYILNLTLYTFNKWIICLTHLKINTCMKISGGSCLIIWRVKIIY